MKLNWNNSLVSISEWLTSDFITNSFSSIKVNSLVFNNLTNFLNPVTLTDLFSFKPNVSMSIPTIQHYLNTFTKEHTINLTEMTNSNNLINYNTTLAFENLKFSTTSIVDTNLHIIGSSIVAELNFLTKPKTDLDALVKIFPEHQDTFDIFEVISINIDNSLYAFVHVPEFKLYYPEPFIASPSFNHEQLWFLHILHYQHWLWFFFISLIWLFFTVFINTVRWSNPRNKPKRETRGVSRSKCADLITACVPVSWAMSIIISESVDAADYYDGFGTGEIVIGIRAYQWGWEYFYPKNIDLSYNINPTYSSIVGNSLKYTKTSEQTAGTNQFWKAMRSKLNVNLTSTPSHTILSPTDNNKILNFINFKSIGDNTVNQSNAFKKIQNSTKINTTELFSTASDFSLKYNKINNLYLTELNPNESNSYGIKRQHQYSSTSTLSNTNSSYLDINSVSKLLDYNYKYNLHTVNNKSSNIVLTDNRTSFNDSNNNKLNTKLSEYKPSNKLVNMGFKSTLDETPYLDNITRQNKSSILSNQKYQKLVINSNNKIDSYEKTVRNINRLNPKKTNHNINISVDMLRQFNTVYPYNSLPHTSYDNKFNLSFDRFTSKNNPAPVLFASEDRAPLYLFSSNWQTLWGNSDIYLRLSNMTKLQNLLKINTLPNIVEYAEYDFLNWQALELLEDLFWDTSFQLYNQDDFCKSLRSATQWNRINLAFLNKINFLADELQELVKGTEFEDLFKPLFRNFTKESRVIDLSAYDRDSKEFKKIVKITHKLFNDFLIPIRQDFMEIAHYLTVPFFTEESTLNPKLTPLLNFGLFSSESDIDTINDSYSSNKALNYINNSSYMNNLGLYNLNNSLLSYTQIFNSFRARSEENINDFDENEFDNNINNIFLNENSDYRSINYLRLRSSTKAAMKTYTAIHKVFKFRFDEGRSNTHLNDFSNMSMRAPFISEQRLKYETLLGKNKESFFEPINYKNTLTTNYNLLSPSINALNTYFANIPFLLSRLSEPSKFVWFDWNSRWNSVEVQPSSVSRYSLMGLPYSTKNFEYATSVSDKIHGSETYLVRLSKARKNYMSNWALTPYMYNRLSNWYSVNGFIGNTLGNQDINNLRVLLVLITNNLDKGNWEPQTKPSTPSFNDYLTPNRASSKPISGLQGYNRTLATLSNILTKREYLYREFFLNKGYSVNIPNYLVSSPKNSLFNEIKNSYTFTDPLNFLTEVNRDFFYENTNVTRFNILSKFLNINNNLNTLPIINNLSYYLFNLNTNNNLNTNYELYKNQYRPMRKGISNMIKLHATGAVAMPIEIRLHLLCSSRDIIHSWSIPSAGIKMDCIPGYSSHRVAIFLYSGIFWGQCMEICGRFHHWMPIIVYFMKRDMFFLWCTHFVHFSTNDLNFSSLDKEFSSKVKQVSFSGNWVN